MAVNRYHNSAGLQRSIEQRILEVFEREGFREVLTPIVEPFEAVSRGLTERMVERSIKFLDRSGILLALRPDITTQVARLVAAAFPSAAEGGALHVDVGDLGGGEERSRGVVPEGKVCYLGTIFRADDMDPSGRQEITQAGAEVFGNDGPGADAGVVSVAAQCLEAVGLNRFKIVVGHVGFVDALLEGVGLDSARARDGLIQCLVVRDIVGFRRRAAEAAGAEAAGARAAGEEPEGSGEGRAGRLGWGCPAGTGQGLSLGSVADLRGGLHVLDAARRVAAVVTPPGSGAGRRALGALAEVEAVLRALAASGFGERVIVDLGLMRRIDYYDGMVFEGFVDGVGRPVCGGGRYNRLMKRLGSDVPATGFAIEIEQAVAAVAGRPDSLPRYLSRS